MDKEDSKRKGGSHKTLVRIKRLLLLMLGVTTLFIILSISQSKISKKLENYQGMHQRLADIETLITKFCEDVPPAECRPSLGEQCQCD